MNRKIFSRLVLLASLAFLLSQGSKNISLVAGEKTDPKKVELKTLKHTELVKAIAAHKGKVVLVDFWGTFCPPCKEKFPKVVHLQEELGSKGLVCISVTFDDAKKHDEALEFLKKNKAAFPNYRVEDPDSCQDHWDFEAVPTYLVFGKDGKLVQKYTVEPQAKKQYTMEDIQKVIENQLK